MLEPPYWQEACAELASRDAVLGELIERYRGERLVSHGDAFITLSRAVVGQQVSVGAADRIWARLVASVKGVWKPEVLLAVPAEQLRQAGLSARKVEYVRGVAHAFLSAQLVPERLAELSNEAVLQHLMRLRGVGRWTAEMFLIFHLLRPDVWPLADLGLRRAASRLYGLSVQADEKAWRALGARFAPWQTVATWYLWRMLDPVAVQY